MHNLILYHRPKKLISNSSADLATIRKPETSVFLRLSLSSRALKLIPLFPQELNLNETPSMLTILDNGYSNCSPSPGNIQVCVGYKNHWDIVNGHSNYAQHLHTVELSRPHLVAALDLYEDQEIQLLLCYNRKSRPTQPNKNTFCRKRKPISVSLCCRYMPLPENKRRQLDLDRLRLPLELGAYGYR